MSPVRSASSILPAIHSRVLRLQYHGDNRPGPVMNDGDRHRRLRAVFDEALEQDPSAREWYLDRTCAEWPDLRAEVMRLLRAHDHARGFLERRPPFPSPPSDGRDDGSSASASAEMDSFPSNRRLS